MNGSVTIHMKAAPGEVFSLVSDVTSIGKYSPETFEAEWTDGATGPAVGAKFRGHVRRNGRGPVYWTKCTVTECEPASVFAFQVDGPGGMAVNTWRYQMEAAGDGTDVTESFQLGHSPVLRFYWMLMGKARGKTNEKGMRTTLESIKAVVESGSAS